MTIFKTVEMVWYFSFPFSFRTKPTEVPATSTSMLWPKEYKSMSTIPKRKLPSPATIARSAMRTGVEQGDAKIPPKMPAMKAPINPLCLFLPKKSADGIKLKISHVCNAIKTMSVPRIRYHREDMVPTSFPADVAMTPKVTKLTAVPMANVNEYKKAFFVFFHPLPLHTRSLRGYWIMRRASWMLECQRTTRVSAQSKDDCQSHLQFVQAKY